MSDMSDLFRPATSAPRGPSIPRSLGIAAIPAMALRLVAPARRPSAAPALPAPMPGLQIDAQARLLHDLRSALCSLGMLADLLHEPGILTHGNLHIAASVSAVNSTLRGLVDTLADSRHAATPAPQTTHSPEPPQQPGPRLVSASDEPEAPLALASEATAASSHSLTPVLAAPSAGDAIQSCAALLRAVAGPLLPVYISSEHALPPLAMLTAELERVLMNLVRNSAEAMPAGGVVRITARRALSRTSPAILIHVSDNGPGIPAQALPRIFEPGFSSKGAIGHAGQPCGLGLAIVRELVEAAGGSVQVASTRHRGTTFELRIPCLQPRFEPQPLPV